MSYSIWVSRFNKYWNPRRDSLSHFILFLEFNSSTLHLTMQLGSWEWLAAIFYEYTSFYLLSPLYLLSVLLISVFLFLFLSLCSLLVFVSSYNVATMVCLHAPCNKLLNKRKMISHMIVTNHYIMWYIFHTEECKIF